MKKKTIHVFDNRGETASKHLRETGMPRRAADILIYLANIPEATSREIETGTGLRQPEVSIGLKYLEERGWLNGRMTLPNGRGRHVQVLSLAVPFESVLESIETEIWKKAKREAALVRKMREIAG